MHSPLPLLAALAMSAALPACDTARDGGTAAAQPEPPVQATRSDDPGAEQEVPPQSTADANEPPTGERMAQAQAGSAESGKLKFNNYCRTCHSVREGDHRLGPSLYGVVGRTAGTAPGYTNYSQAMKRSGIVWNEETLDRFLADPDKLVPGNNMKPFARIADPTVRQDIIAHLQQMDAESSQSSGASRER